MLSALAAETRVHRAQVILPGLVSAAVMQTFAERFLQRDMRELPRFGALRAHRYQVRGAPGR